ncbi:MAG: hypothetical protein DRJ61_15785 [Acidobacteria bacterium]|nr:MAG: hypothetical protein DRJ61_15785 [Acidobacteriota bacterium]
MTAPKTDYFPLGGGIDLSTPALSAIPGTLLDAINFTPDINGGYRLSGLYERVDGRSAPSDAAYYMLAVADESSYSAGDSILGGTSGATAEVVNTATGFLVITELTSNFTAAESIGATTVTTVEEISGESSISTELQYRSDAQDHYRTSITIVPGSGAIRGVWRHKESLYAFRDNAGATAVDCYKATSSGWTQVVFASHYISYDAGVSVFAVGDAVTGTTSLATGTVHRVVVHTGSYTTGYIVLTGVTGTFVDNEPLQVSAATKATSDGGSTLMSLPAGGVYQFNSHNFLATSSSHYVYGVNGVGPAFEIDNNDVFSPILMAAINGAPDTNTPHLVEIHKGHLFLAFPNGIMEHSTITDAMTFDGFLGSVEFGLSDDITGMISVAGGVLLMFTRSQTWALYGNNALGWSLQSASDNTGALLYGTAPIGRIYAWDDQGIIRMDRVQAFGDFQSSTVSKSVQRVLSENTSNLVATIVYKERDQFWLVLSTGDIIVAHVDEVGLVSYGWISLGFTPSCAYNAPDENGNERIYIGASTGFVYELNKGMAQDGVAMEFGFRTTYNHFRSPRLRKSFKHLQVEIETSSVASFDIATEYDYSASYAANNVDISASASGGAGFWETALWNAFTWDSQDIPTSEMSITGTGMNISLIIYGTSKLLDPFTMQGFMIHYIPRRITRG